MVDWVTILSAVIFYSIIAIYFWVRRKNITVQYKILILYRSKFWAKVIGRFAKKAPKFWQWFGYFSIPAGFVGMALILGFLFWKLVEMFIVPGAIPAVSPVLPGIRIPGASIYLPFWYGILSLMFVIVVHEFAHGLVAESWGLKLKAAGVGLLALLPLAFVEPDPKKLKKLPVKKQLAIFGAGPFSNMVWALIIFLIISFVAAPVAAGVLEPNGLFVESVTMDFPAETAGLQKGDTILAVDSIPINTSLDFVDYMSDIKPGQSVTLTTARGPVEITTTQNPENESKSYMGVQFSQNVDVKPSIREKYGKFPIIIFYISQLLNWIFVLSIGIGLVNLLPLSIMDGGQMLKSVLDSKLKKRKQLIKHIWTFVTITSLFLLLMNLVGPYFIKALI